MKTCHLLYDNIAISLYQKEAKKDYRILWWACCNNSVSTLRRVIEHRVPKYSDAKDVIDYVFQNRHGEFREVYTSKLMTPLSVAVRFGSVDAMKYLLGCGADVNQPDGTQMVDHEGIWFPINWAASCTTLVGKEFDRCMRLLLEHGANVNQVPLKTGPQQRRIHTPGWSHWADGEWLSTGDTPSDEGYLSRYPLHADAMPLFHNLDLLFPEFDNKFFPVQRQQERQELISKRLRDRFHKTIALLKLGADPNTRDPYRHTPIFHVMLCLKWLNPVGSDDERWSDIPIFYGVEDFRKNFAIPHALALLQLFVQRGGDVNVECEGTTALHVISSAHSRYEKVVNYLLKQGADIHATDSKGRTPLYYIVLGSNIHDPGCLMVKKFLRAGAEVDHRDKNGDTPLHVLCHSYRGSSDILDRLAKTLVSRGANPCATNSDDQTPLDVLYPPMTRSEIVETLQASMKMHMKVSQQVEDIDHDRTEDDGIHHPSKKKQPRIVYW